MVRGICDDWHRLPARLYTALEVECGCCTFYRGAMLFGALGLVIGFGATALYYSL